MRVKKNEAISPLLPLYFIINGFIDDQILYTLFTKWFHHLYHFSNPVL